MSWQSPFRKALVYDAQQEFEMACELLASSLSQSSAFSKLGTTKHWFPRCSPERGSKVRTTSGMVHIRKAICFEVVTMDSAYYSVREAL